MINRRFLVIFSRAIVFIGALAATASAWAGESISDAFGSDGRGPGQRLNLSSTEQGGLEWSASANLVILPGEEGGVLAPDNGNTFFGHVPIPKNAQEIEVSIDAKPEPVDDNEEAWVAVGMGPETYENKLTWGNGLFLLLMKSGEYQIVANADGDPSKVFRIKGLAPNYSLDGLNKLTLVYDRAANAVIAKINGEQVGEPIDLLRSHVVLDPAVAGISGFGQKKAARFDNFSLTIK